MKISKLWLENVDKQLIERFLFQDNINISDRFTGKSTGVALSIIGSAMVNPSKAIKITEKGYYHADRFLCEMIQNILDNLNLKHFTIRKSDMTLTYDPFVEAKIKLTLEV